MKIKFTPAERSLVMRRANNLFQWARKTGKALLRADALREAWAYVRIIAGERMDFEFAISNHMLITEVQALRSQRAI